MSVTCPSITEAATYASSYEDNGYRCLEVRLRDATAGFTFRVEPGSPAEAAATACWVTDINRLIAPGQVEPRRLPLISSGGASKPEGSRVMSMSLLAGSPIQGLLTRLGAPLGGVILRFSNVVVSVGGAPKQLRADVADLASPTLYDAACAVQGELLRCSPWPYVDEVIGDQTASALTLVIQTPLNVLEQLEYALGQSVEFFTNVEVQVWTPTDSLLESVDSAVAITGASFLDSSALQCLWYEDGASGLFLVSMLPAKYISSTLIECSISNSLFNQTGLQTVLHLSLDGGMTYEFMAGAASGLTMRFSLLRAP